MPFVCQARLDRLLVEPFGQTERGENPLWSESHDSQAMAFLLTAGQSLMGLIMADHQAELSWLLAKPEVDRRAGGRDGRVDGRHARLWFAALDPRARAAVAVAVAPLARANWAWGPQGLCDLMVGLFRVADDDLIPRPGGPRAPFLEICPSVQAPLSAEGERHCQGTIGGPGYAEASKRYPLTPDEFGHSIRLRGKPTRCSGPRGPVRIQVIEGPHDYTRSMRASGRPGFSPAAGSEATLPDRWPSRRSRRSASGRRPGKCSISGPMAHGRPTSFRPPPTCSARCGP